VLAGTGSGRLAVLLNRSGHEIMFHLPARSGHRWEGGPRARIGPRSVALVTERPIPATQRRRRAVPLEAQDGET
jgi:hypothetical protein